MASIPSLMTEFSLPTTHYQQSADKNRILPPLSKQFNWASLNFFPTIESSSLYLDKDVSEFKAYLSQNSPTDISRKIMVDVFIKNCCYNKEFLSRCESFLNREESARQFFGSLSYVLAWKNHLSDLRLWQHYVVDAPLIPPHRMLSEQLWFLKNIPPKEAHFQLPSGHAYVWQFAMFALSKNVV